MKYGDPLLHEGALLGVGGGEARAREDGVEVAVDGPRLVELEAVVVDGGDDAEGLPREVLGALLLPLGDVDVDELERGALLVERTEDLARAGAARETVDLQHDGDLPVGNG